VRLPTSFKAGRRKGIEAAMMVAELPQLWLQLIDVGSDVGADLQALLCTLSLFSYCPLFCRKLGLLGSLQGKRLQPGIDV
jgi:hypothetical protein